jgi:hypothetical protein
MRRTYDIEAACCGAWTAHPDYLAPLHDAFARGRLPSGGLCLTGGSGAGPEAQFIQGWYPQSIAVDLSMGMLSSAPRGSTVQGDMAQCPFRPHSIDVAVLLNAPLFPEALSDCPNSGWDAGVGVELRGDKPCVPAVACGHRSVIHGL